jgi:hypothetical protein
MKQLFEFPSKIKIDIVGEKNQKVNIFAILEGIEGSKVVYIKLVNAKIQEIHNTFSAFGRLTPQNFKSYDSQRLQPNVAETRRLEKETAR